MIPSSHDYTDFEQFDCLDQILHFNENLEKSIEQVWSIEMVLLSTHNICFCRELRKITFDYPLYLESQVSELSKIII